MPVQEQKDRAARDGELFRLLVENVVDYAIFVVDAGGLVRSWSHGAEKLLGYREDEILGRTADVFYTPEDLKDHVPQRERQEALATGRGDDDRWHVRKDGTRFWSGGVMTPLRDEGGGLRGFAKIMRDRTEWWHAERARREGERRTHAILESITDAFFALDRDWRFTYINRQAEALLGRTRGDLLGKGLWEEYAPILGTEFEHGYRRAMDQDVTVTFEAFYPPHDRWYEVHSYPSAEGLAVYFRDVTGRKRAEERHSRLVSASEQQRRIYETALSSTPDFNYIFDLEGRFTYVNSALLGLWRKGLDEAVGRDFFDLGYPPDLAARLQRQIRQVIDTKQSVRDETPYTSHLGERQYEYIFVPVLGAGGAVEAVAGSTRDITERKQAEEALREGEERFRGLMEQAPFSIQVLSPDGRTLRVNRAWEELWGLSLEEIADYNMLRDPQLESKGILPHIRRAFAGEPVAVPAIEYDPNETLPDRTRHEDPRRWVSAVAYPLKDAAGRVREVVLVHDDITERRRAEDRLRESEARFRQLADTMPQIVWVTRPDGYHEYYNRRWYDYIGCTPEECLGHGWNAPLHPEDRQRAIDRWDLALRTGEPYEIEYRFRSKGGEYRWFLARALPVRDDGGRIVRWFGTCTDIEDLKRSERLLREGEARYRAAEQALRASQERLMAALSASETGTFRWDPETGVFLDFDDSLRHLFGLAPEDRVEDSEDLLSRVHPDDRSELAAAVDRSRRGEDFEMEHRVVLPDGGVRWLYDRGKMVRDGGGRPAYLVGACTDITKRKRVEEVLQDADRRKDEFLATLAHELRNPLAPIRNALHLMREPALDCDGIEAERAMAERQVVHLARLVDDLMDVARINQGKVELRKQDVDLATVVNQAVETARPLVDERRHRLTVSLPEGPIRLEADPTRLEQVLWNLLNNAAKYTDPGGRIELSVERDGDEVAVRVRDTGIGIEPAMLPRVFEMFAQVDHRSDRTQGGLGIGLGLVKTLVEMHGGTITASSDGPGEGSEFVVRLPVPPAPSPEAVRPVTDGLRGTEATLPRRRILVVDDNVDAASSLARLLSRLHGQEVRIAHDGPSALTAAEEFGPEVILLDIGLPGMDGYEVARQLREMPQFAGTLIVALTGWGQESDRRRSEEARIDHHLVKPVDLDTLGRLLAEAATGGAG